MSRENVEIVREAFEASSRDDMEGVLRLCDESIVITQPPELPEMKIFMREEQALEAAGLSE
jgi:ketosteroid isomerase-like protein